MFFWIFFSFVLVDIVLIEILIKINYESLDPIIWADGFIAQSNYSKFLKNRLDFQKVKLINRR